MVHRHRILPLLFVLLLGIFAGGIIDAIVIAVVWFPLRYLGLKRHGIWFDLLVMDALLLWVGIISFLLMVEWLYQRSQYWIATNRCENCGCNLKDLPEKSSQCPQCGFACKSRRDLQEPQVPPSDR